LGLVFRIVLEISQRAARMLHVIAKRRKPDDRGAFVQAAELAAAVTEEIRHRMRIAPDGYW
jgi:hypothetical protein